MIDEFQNTFKEETDRAGRPTETRLGSEDKCQRAANKQVVNAEACCMRW